VIGAGVGCVAATAVGYAEGRNAPPLDRDR
jgi:hypothetical protein